MSWVLYGSVTVCRTQQYQVADCSIIKHQPQQTIGRADQWVMTADVAWTACQTNGADLQPYPSVNERQLSPACSGHALGNWRVSVMWSERHKPVMDRAAALSNEHWLQTVAQVRLVSPPAQHCRSQAVTKRERQRTYGTRTSELIVGYCASDIKRRRSWQLFFERGIAWWGWHRSKFRALRLRLRLAAWRGQNVDSRRAMERGHLPTPPRHPPLAPKPMSNSTSYSTKHLTITYPFHICPFSCVSDY